MKKLFLLLALGAGVLGGCAMHSPYPGPDLPTAPRISFEPRVNASGVPGFSVSPRVLVFQKRGEVKVTWTLDPGSRLTFAAKDGIFIDGEVKTRVQAISPNVALQATQRSLGASQEYLDPEQDEIVNCEVAKDRLSATCTNRHTRAGKFKYSVRLTDGKSDYVLDPDVNNW